MNSTSRRPALLVVFALLAVSCAPDQVSVDATYDEATGRLTRLAADLDKNGRADTWTYMDGSTPVRTEQDLDGDGRIERWELLGPGGHVVELAISRRKTGQPDIWTYFDANAQPIRIESASTDARGADGQAKIDRIEIFTDDLLTRVEEDTDRDGRMDKWEQHEGPILISVELDHDRDGRPDERVSFGPDGTVLERKKLGGAL